MYKDHTILEPIYSDDRAFLLNDCTLVPVGIRAVT
jgi:hypothetical protein